MAASPNHPALYRHPPQALNLFALLPQVQVEATTPVTKISAPSGQFRRLPVGDGNEPTRQDAKGEAVQISQQTNKKVLSHSVGRSAHDQKRSTLRFSVASDLHNVSRARKGAISSQVEVKVKANSTNGRDPRDRLARQSLGWRFCIALNQKPTPLDVRLLRNPNGSCRDLSA